MIHWTHQGQPHQAHWRSESGAPASRRVVTADDTLAADTAYRMACEGTGLLWQGDFQNARLLLQALMRRADGKSGKAGKPRKSAAKAAEKKAAAATPAEAFHLHRQAQAQRARVLASVLIPLEGDYAIDLRRAPDWRQACSEAWGPATGERSVATLRELLGLVGAHEWRKKGVEVPALGAPPHNRIHPHYGVFSPVRGEYVGLVADAALPGKALAFDIGVGTGVLSAVLARRGVQRVVATDQDPRALACARENLQRLGVLPQVELLQADLFPPGRAPLVVCNPPWVPARASSPIERAVYDEGSRMLKGFLAGLADHLEPGGEGWLILSDLAEHLGLRPRAQLLQWIAEAGLVVRGRTDVKPLHPKAADAGDALHAARAAEVTSLWRLAAA
ncbi:class I SAM-dependent methyltransferase [Acidovorax sp. FHTAMBA]|jgi:methylase of polypeptide subunit release factors|uniref:methyltransferase n=1 Tax=Acidovorax sp. FHTAMBA TaxID=3140252 RepID=UPI0015F5587E